MELDAEIRPRARAGRLIKQARSSYHHPVKAGTRNAYDVTVEAGNACIQTYGGYGFAEEYDIERKFREARLYQVAPVSTNLILSFIAEHVLKLPRSY